MVAIKSDQFKNTKLSNLPRMSVSDVADIDSWLQLLLTCKQLPEAEVKKLCDKVISSRCSTDPLSIPLIYILAFIAVAILTIGSRDFDGGIQRAAGPCPGDRLWGYPRPISRSSRALLYRRKLSRYKLFVHGGLCRQRILLCGNSHAVGCFKSQIQKPRYYSSRESRVSPNYPSLWVL